jgi:hypothetical protein
MTEEKCPNGRIKKVRKPGRRERDIIQPSGAADKNSDR